MFAPCQGFAATPDPLNTVHT